MSFSLKGFTQDTGCRIFEFEHVDEDRVRRYYTVRADLELARRYDIRMQELPFLCQRLIGGHLGGASHQIFTFTEEDMKLYSDGAASAKRAAAAKRKPPRRPIDESTRVDETTSENPTPAPILSTRIL